MGPKKQNKKNKVIVGEKQKGGKPPKGTFIGKKKAKNAKAQKFANPGKMSGKVKGKKAPKESSESSNEEEGDDDTLEDSDEDAGFSVTPMAVPAGKGGNKAMKAKGGKKAVVSAPVEDSDDEDDDMVENDDEEMNSQEEEEEDEDDEQDDDNHLDDEEEEVEEEVLAVPKLKKNKNKNVANKQQTVGGGMMEVSGKSSAKNDGGNAASDSARVFINGLSYDTDEHSLSQFFKQHGLITTDVYIAKNMGKSKGFAFVTFNSSDASATAVGLSGQNLDGRDISIFVAKPKRPSDAAGTEAKELNILFVKDLPSDTTKDCLEEFFPEASDIRLLMNPDGSCKGQAFVEFSSHELAKSAKESMTGSDINGTEVKIDYAFPRGSSRGRGGMGFRGRGADDDGRRGFRGSRGGGNFFGGGGRGAGKSFGRGRDNNFGAGLRDGGVRGRGGFRGARGAGRRAFGGQRGRGSHIQFNDGD